MKNEKLTKAKVSLIIQNPFFASLLLSMNFQETDQVETFATDGENILFNPDFVETLTVSETQFILAHETMHCVFQHMNRLGNRDAEIWNIATDYIINGLLINETGVGTMPKVGLLNEKIVKEGGGTADGVYNILYSRKKNPQGQGQGQGQKPGQGQGQGQGQKPLDKLIQPNLDPSQLSQKEAEMRVKVAQARNAAKMRGTLSAGIDRLVEQLLKSKTDWRHFLRNFLSEKTKNEFSFARPKRRFLAEDLCLPSLIGEKLGKISVAIDCSGSIDEKILGLFETEIKAIVEDTAPTEIEIIYFDSKILKVETFDSDNQTDLKLSPVGGGGTNFAPIFEHIIEQEIQPVAVVVITDLYCPDFGICPDCPVLWASTTEKPPFPVPFGQVIYLDPEQEYEK